MNRSYIPCLWLFAIAVIITGASCHKTSGPAASSTLAYISDSGVASTGNPFTAYAYKLYYNGDGSLRSRLYYVSGSFVDSTIYAYHAGQAIQFLYSSTSPGIPASVLYADTFLLNTSGDIVYETHTQDSFFFSGNEVVSASISRIPVQYLWSGGNLSTILIGQGSYDSLLYTYNTGETYGPGDYLYVHDLLTYGRPLFHNKNTVASMSNGGSPSAATTYTYTYDSRGRISSCIAANSFTGYYEHLTYAYSN